MGIEPVGGDEFALLTSGISLVNDIALFVEFDIRLADDPFVLFPSGQVERIRFKLSLFAVLDLLVCGLDVFKRHVLARLEGRVSAVVDLDVLDHAAVDHASVR